MLLDGAGEVVEMFRNSFPLSFLFFVPLLILISPVSPAHDFAVYRMQQYDLQGSAHGCRNALINVEARPITAAIFTRKCIIAKLKELTIEKYKEMVQQNAGGLLVLIPTDLGALDKEEKEHLLELEQDLMEEDTQVPVYFAKETEELNAIYDDVKSSGNADAAGSALEALMGSATSNGFQLVVGGSQSKALNDFEIVNIQGKLSGYGMEEQLPTVIIVAHYDAYGIAPSLSFGSDSNASGVVALLELSRLFSKLYTNSRSHAKYNLLFLLTGAGKFNYQGTKRWLDDQIESGETSHLTDVSFVVCLDTIGSGDTLHAHVSKPPKEGSATDVLFKNIERLANSSNPEMNFKMVHKKINLAEDYLAWEHERFSIQRLPAFTVSRLESFKSPLRNTILDRRDSVDTKVLVSNIKILAESLARHVFNLSSDEPTEVFSDGLGVDEELVSSWMDYLSSRPRSAQLLGKDAPELASLEQSMAKHLKDVRRHTFKADKRDPEVVFYNGAEFTMNAYSVKPAIFDLFLGLAIAAYLALLYLLSQNFQDLYSAVRKLNGHPNSSKKSQ